jgi:hypothetical protein
VIHECSLGLNLNAAMRSRCNGRCRQAGGSVSLGGIVQETGLERDPDSERCICRERACESVLIVFLNPYIARCDGKLAAIRHGVAGVEASNSLTRSSRKIHP